MIVGKNYIAGKWLGNERTFRSHPAEGYGAEFSEANAQQLDQAVRESEEAFSFYSQLAISVRAAFLNNIADELESFESGLLEVCNKETGLAVPRLKNEFDRTVNQLRYFSCHIQKREFLDFRHDKSMPNRLPMPRADLKLIQRPLGPVAIFGASNFPMAFSTLGGDTAAALAAGCTVVVKGHSAHTGTADIAAQAMHAAIAKSGVHSGVFSQLQGSGFVVGQELVKHPLIKAVGFTGSLGGGRALFDLCAARAEPIPFFGELGSINPVFVLPAVMQTRADDIARRWAESVTASAGQFCTNPGLIVIKECDDADAFIEAARMAMQSVASQTMLSEGICSSFHEGHNRLRDSPDTTQLLTTVPGRRNASPALFKTSGAAWLRNASLGEEVFGPLGLVVLAKDDAEFREIAHSLDGQLVCTIQMDTADSALAKQLLPIMERKAGRIVVNGFPTGVEVCDSMVHGGPYPASTNFGATSVGSMSIRRFLRPVCYQDLPLDLWSSSVSEQYGLDTDIKTQKSDKDELQAANSPSSAANLLKKSKDASVGKSNWFIADSRNRQLS